MVIFFKKGGGQYVRKIQIILKRHYFSAAAARPNVLKG